MKTRAYNERRAASGGRRYDCQEFKENWVNPTCIPTYMRAWLSRSVLITK